MLSVILPVFNEIRTLPTILVAVSAALPTVEKEVILIDDGSTDGSRAWIERNFPDGPRSGSGVRIDARGDLAFSSEPNVPHTTIKPLYHPRNRGKGACLATALAASTGEIIVIQDADLEYDPADWKDMYEMISNRKIADVVYGSRFRNRRNRSRYLTHYVGNQLISRIFNILYNQALTDVEVCYKMFKREVKDQLRITCNDFGCEIQISAQIARLKRWRISEVGVSYFGRSYGDGKKLRYRDGFKALWYLVRFRLYA